MISRLQLTAIAKTLCLPALLLTLSPFSSPGAVLWSDPAARVIHKSTTGVDLLGGILRRDDSSGDTLYFKFRINPLSDVASEPYSAAFQLFTGDSPGLAVGNALEPWAYSAFNTAESSTLTGAKGEFDLNSARREAVAMGEFKPYELSRQNRERTIVFKVQFLPGAHDLVTVWMDPKLAAGATDENQPELLTTRFKADASFNQIRLIHDGGGNGWIFSDMAVATHFQDFVVVRFWQTWWFITISATVLLLLVVVTVRLIERRKFQRRLQRAEWERMMERERSRIAQDLHDELGSSLARISLVSNLVKLDKDHPAEVEAHAVKLAQSADQAVRSLEEIVWAVRSGSDSLQSLMDYIAHFADEVSKEKVTRCRLDLPPDLPQRSLPPEYRHNVFLIVKEAITNAVKHARAKEVHVRAQALGDTLEIEITDDGHGFDAASALQAKNRNGLHNMKQRADSIHATLDISSSPDKGSAIRLTSPFPKVQGAHS